MKVNHGIEIDDSTREHLASLIDGKSTKRKATRDEVRALVDKVIERIPYIDIDADRPASDESLADDVIHDIDEGGWSLIGL